MVQSALLLLALAGQQPAQQPAASAPKPQVNASQRADTSKAKHRARRSRNKAKANTAAPRDTTKAKP